MKNNRLLALVILIIPIIVLASSTLTFYLGYKPNATTNNGQLIVPQIATDDLSLSTPDGKPFLFKKGKWYLIYFEDFQNLELSNEKYKMLFSLNTTLGREMNRVKRAVILKEDVVPGEYADLQKDYPNVFFLLDKNSVLSKRISEFSNDPFSSKSIFLLDDFSNLMEEFPNNLEFKEIFEDLKTLL
mgnify:CR=1 FL=1